MRYLIRHVKCMRYLFRHVECMRYFSTSGYYTRVFEMFKDTQAVDSDRST